MSTVEKGDELELAIFDLLQTEIDEDRFFAKKSCCQIFRKKGYYSRDRQSEIVFDISIEIRFPGADDYSVLFLVECKNYSHRVPVDDVEEFFIKVEQVGSANTKAVVVTSAAYQAGALAFAKSRKIGLARYFPSHELKWELRRSASASATAQASDGSLNIEAGLTQSDFRSSIFDLYFQSSTKATNSLWGFFEDMVVDSRLSKSEFRSIHNPRGRKANIVPFIHRSELEIRAAQVLDAVGYEQGYVNLDRLCSHHPVVKSLQVVRKSPDSHEIGHFTLGRISFEPLIIEIFTDPTVNAGRDRFTLAHELAHLLLDHGNFMRSESCNEGDFKLQMKVPRDESDISRIEYQANYFAASLLMPVQSFVTDFAWELRRLDLTEKGKGPLYVDEQECNINNYMEVTGRLMKFYGVSRQAVSIRLEGLGLMRDVRRASPPADQADDFSWIAID